MKNLRVANKHLGEVIINSHLDLEKPEEYAIKSLAMLQMVCINPNEKQRFPEFLSIIDEAITKANALYGNGETNVDPTDLFN